MNIQLLTENQNMRPEQVASAGSRALYHAAVELESGQRAVFLAKACGEEELAAPLHFGNYKRTPEGIKQAIESFRQVIDLDSNYAMALGYSLAVFSCPTFSCVILLESENVGQENMSKPGWRTLESTTRNFSKTYIGSSREQ